MTIIRLFLFLFILCITSPVSSQPLWQLNKDKNGIRVYTKKSDSSSFKFIKVEGVFDGSWEKLFAILKDIKLQVQWVYHSKKAYVVKKIADNELLYYTETSLPWPVSNRDAVVRMKLYNDPSRNIHRVLSIIEPDIVQETKGIVRIHNYRADWEVKTLEKNKIAITYFLELQPGGSLPAWVVNMFITNGPYETFARLAELLKK